jgi:hypothetical protein
MQIKFLKPQVRRDGGGKGLHFCPQESGAITQGASDFRFAFQLHSDD